MKLLWLLVALPAVLSERTLSIGNRCPADVTLYINGASMGIIAGFEGQYHTTMQPNFSGFIYTSANGGNANGTGTTRAGFFLQNDQYYVVIDPAHFNTAVRITPITNSTQANGFCPDVRCSAAGCPEAFQQPPTRFPPPATTAPAPPLYRCPGTTTGYVVTFCPDNTFPPGPVDNHWLIHPGGHINKCLDVRGNVRANGTPVQVYDCNGSGAQNWIINTASTKVQLAGTNFCLDAGSTPGNGVGMKIWQCYDNLPAQQWYLTDDNRIALQNQGLCLDLPSGRLDNSNQAQTWQCTDNNFNQVWIRRS
ncbi:hypothetical protein HGRIS_008748 [Hohenbuehelia grisea]|uniref:Ricin B lectin domain-containing protein n=1 Tax=Hohenbuehelia grisea TaxID=104357 RepID=A0ABR3J8Z1_9AGAR